MKFVLQALAVGLVLLMCSCESTQRVLKAKPVPTSAFLKNVYPLKPVRHRVPFHAVHFSSDSEVKQRASAKTEIYVAPVELAHLRPVKKALARNQVAGGSINRNEAGVAQRLRSVFQSRFEKGQHPRYRSVAQPSAQSVTLELAIVELNPTSPHGNAVKTAAKFVVGPLAGLGGIFTKGNMAIEGKVTNSETGELLFAFADNEADKMTFYSLKDYRPYGHAFDSIEQWADQFATFTRTNSAEKVKDSSFFTLDPLTY